MIEQRQYVDAVGRLTFLGRLMSVFVFDILQIPSGWNEICIRHIGSTSTLPGYGLALFFLNTILITFGIV